MEVLIRWQCPLCPQFQGQCPSCNGTGYLERWIPYLLLPDLRANFKNAFLIIGRRKISALALACLD